MPNEFNQKIIEEFRANGGVVSGPMGAMKLLLLTTRGARTGNEHTTPVAYNRIDGKLVIIASYGGSPTNPQWYRNLAANSEVTVEMGTEKFTAHATPIADEAERARMFDAFAELNPNFKEYRAKTDRKIPVIVLEKAPSAAAA